MTTCGTLELARLVGPCNDFSFSVLALVHLMTEYKKHVPTAVTSSTVVRIKVTTAAGGRSYLLGRCVEAPPAGLTGVLRWRRGRLAAEGRVSVRLITSLTFTGLLNISRVHTQPVTAGCKHPEKYTQIHTNTACKKYSIFYTQPATTGCKHPKKTHIEIHVQYKYSVHNQLLQDANVTE